jgi:hypothetical protein
MCEMLPAYWRKLLAFANVQKVYKPIYKPTEPITPQLVEAPEDLVGWFQNHPNLKLCYSGSSLR